MLTKSSTITTEWFNGDQVISSTPIRLYGVLTDEVVASGNITLKDRDGTTVAVIGSNESVMFDMPIAFTKGLNVAYSGTGNYSIVYECADYASTITQQLLNVGGLTFFKDYSTNKPLAADFSIGSPASTYTASRDATHPATYVDKNGVIQLTTTSNMPRFQGGYYDTTGFHASKGLMVEGSATNYLLYSTFSVDAGSGLSTGWSQSNSGAGGGNTYTPTLEDDNTVGILGKVQRFQVSAADANVYSYIIQASAAGTFAVGDKATFSIWIKGSSTSSGGIVLRIREYADAVAGTSSFSSVLSISSSEWRRFSFTLTCVDAGTNKVQVYVGSSDTDAGQSYDIYIANAQLEKSSYATSFIPTTTAALTRNADVLKYLISGNRTAAQETIVIKFTPTGNFANDGVVRFLLDNDDATHDRRNMYKAAAFSRVSFSPNATDSVDCVAGTNTTPLNGVSYVVAAVANGTLPLIYFNGVYEATDTDTYSVPTLDGTYFYVGSRYSGELQLNGIINSIAIFNRALSTTKVATVTNILT